jgi:hypothetical protein
VGDVVDVVARIAVSAANLADREHAPWSTRRPDSPRAKRTQCNCVPILVVGAIGTCGLPDGTCVVESA